MLIAYLSASRLTLLYVRFLKRSETRIAFAIVSALPSFVDLSYVSALNTIKRM
jgi:hypothetical protein